MSIKNMRNLNLPHEPKLDRDATQTSGKADEECECHILFNKRVNSNPMRKTMLFYFLFSNFLQNWWHKVLHGSPGYQLRKACCVAQN